MESIIRKWGNSPALRLPVGVLKEAAFGLEQKVRLTVSPGRIVIEPSDAIEYDLRQLVDAITPENAQPEAGFGAPVGKETL